MDGESEMDHVREKLKEKTAELLELRTENAVLKGIIDKLRGEAGSAQIPIKKPILDEKQPDLEEIPIQDRTENSV